LLHIIFTIILFLLCIASTTILFFALRKINQYESIILNFNNRVEHIKQQLKLIDDKGHFEADDEIGFFFDEIKLLSSDLEELFEPLEEVVDEKNPTSKIKKEKEK